MTEPDTVPAGSDIGAGGDVEGPGAGGSSSGCAHGAAPAGRPLVLFAILVLLAILRRRGRETT